MFAKQLHPIWREILADQLELLTDVEARVKADPLSIPKTENILRAFKLPPQDYRVLIVGQDPYPNPDHAIGLSFAVPEGTKPLPPTLSNIFKELRSDLGEQYVKTGDISPWATRGVMLLNRHLTTQANNTAAHLDLGWAQFTTAAVVGLQEALGSKLVAILWGQRAGELLPLLKQATVISSSHPSPLSSYRGFFGSRPFSRCNTALLELGLSPIDWSA
jgi:uracil-DNA glycosylase